MDQRDLDYYNRCWFQWAEYIFLDSRSVQGLLPAVWPDIVKESDSKPPRRKNRPRLCNSEGKPMKCLYRPQLDQPHGDRAQSSSKPLTHRLDKTSEKIHQIAVVQPNQVKGVIICLWQRRNTFAEISQIMKMTSKQIGQTKHNLLCEAAKVA